MKYVSEGDLEEVQRAMEKMYEHLGPFPTGNVVTDSAQAVITTLHLSTRMLLRAIQDAQIGRPPVLHGEGAAPRQEPTIVIANELAEELQAADYWVHRYTMELAAVDALLARRQTGSLAELLDRRKKNLEAILDRYLTEWQRLSAEVMAKKGAGSSEAPLSQPGDRNEG